MASSAPLTDSQQLDPRKPINPLLIAALSAAPDPTNPLGLGSGDGTQSAEEIPSVPQPQRQMNRVEDDRTAGTRGTTPQSPTTAPLAARIPQTDANVNNMHSMSQNGQQVSPGRFGLEQTLNQEQQQYDRMTQPPPKKTLAQKIMGGIGAGALGFSGRSGAVEQELTRRDQEAAQQRQERENLAGRISQGRTALAQEDITTQRMEEQAELQKEAEVASAAKLGQTITGQANVANIRAGGQEGAAQIRATGAEDVATIRGQYQADAAAGKPIPTKTLMVGGKSMVMGWNPSSRQFDVPMGEAPPTYAQVAPSLKTIDVIDPSTGLPTIQTLSGKNLGTAATGAYGHEMAQAGAVARGGTELISQLSDPSNREILGKLNSYISQGTLGTPLADQKAAYLSSQLKTFAALQPAMHGFRSRSAQEAFEKIVGGLAQNPDATIGAIQGILKTSSAVNPSLSDRMSPKPAPQSSAGGATHRFNPATGAIEPIGTR